VGKKGKGRTSGGKAQNYSERRKAESAARLLDDRRIYILLLVILGIGLVLRLAYLWTISDSAIVQHHVIMTEADDHAFFQWAQRILAGDWLGRDTYHPYFGWMQSTPLETWYRWWGGKEVFHQSPLYPYFLAVFLGISGSSVGFVFFVQLLFGALQVLIVYWLAARLFDRQTGIVAAALTAIYGPFIFHQGLMLRDWIPPLLEPLVLLLLLRARALGRGWILAGGAIGLAIASKETSMLLVPVALLWLMYEFRTEWRRMLRTAALLVAGMLAALSPVYLRNAIVGAPFFSISTRGIEVVATGMTNMERVHGRQIMEESQGQTGLMMLKLFQSYGNQWKELSWRIFNRLAQIIDTFENPDNISFAYGQSVWPALKILPGYWIVMPLGLAALLLSMGSWRKYLLVYLYTLACLAGLVVTVVRARYRLTLATILILFAASVLVRLAMSIRNRKYREAAVVCGLIVLFGACQQFVSYSMAASSEDRVRAVDFLAAARVYVQDERFNKAADEMSRLLKRAREESNESEKIPLYEAEYHIFSARHSIQDKDIGAARESLKKAQEAYGRASNPASYPYYEMGLAYLKLNDNDKAAKLFRRFLEIEPAGPSSDSVRKILNRIVGTPF
jgi:4-amino-4-deoxy-L-arabinose transferase-like glycosyltransferase